MYYCDPTQYSFLKWKTCCITLTFSTLPSSVTTSVKTFSFPSIQMYGRYTQELGVFAKEEAARLRDGGVRDGGGMRRNASVRSRADLLEYEKDPCAKCQCK